MGIRDSTLSAPFLLYHVGVGGVAEAAGVGQHSRSGSAYLVVGGGPSGHTEPALPRPACSHSLQRAHRSAPSALRGRGAVLILASEAMGSLFLSSAK